MNIFNAISNGFKNVLQSSRYVFLAYTINLLLVLILGIGLASILNESLGQSTAADNMRNGFDDVWYQTFSSEAHGLTATFHPSVVGIGAVFDGLEKMLNGSVWKGLAMGGFLYVLLWTFLSAGFIAVYAASNDQPPFFQGAAEFFPRFLILAVMAGVAYFLLFYFGMQWLGKAVDELTRETIDERVHFLYVALKYLVVWVLIGFVNLVFDYSKIFTVVKDHKNAFSAPLAAVRLVFSNFGKTYGLYLNIAIVWTVLMLLYWVVAPGAGQSSWFMIVGAFIVSQIYILMRITTRCLFYAGQTAMYGYIAAEH